MTGFEPRIFGTESNFSTKRATTTSIKYYMISQVKGVINRNHMVGSSVHMSHQIGTLFDVWRGPPLVTHLRNLNIFNGQSVVRLKYLGI